MKKLFNTLTDECLPVILGVIWLIIICVFSLGAAIWSFKWVLNLIGVL